MKTYVGEAQQASLIRALSHRQREYESMNMEIFADVTFFPLLNFRDEAKKHELFPTTPIGIEELNDYYKI